MSKLVQTREPNQYAPENLMEDTDWGFLFSYTIEPLTNEDHELSKLFPLMQKQRNEVFSKIAESKLDPIDRFQNVIEVKKESFKKAKKSSYENWEKKISQLCISMHQSVEKYYYRRALTYRELLLSSQLDRNPTVLFGDCRQCNNIMEEIAMNSWIFPSLPGTNPDTNWPFTLNELYTKVSHLRPLALWCEPFDENYNFQEAAYKFFKGTLERFGGLSSAQSGSVKAQDQERIKELKGDAKLALLNIFGITVNSGSYERMLHFIDFILDPTGNPELDAIKNQCITESFPEMKNMLLKIEKEQKSHKIHHYIRPESTQGTFKLAKSINFSSLNSTNCSLATDGSYLYVYMCSYNKGTMLKVGTGEFGTIAGKIYLCVTSEKENDGCWVYCQGKLYLRRNSDEPGLINVISPTTFKKIGLLKLSYEEAFKETATSKYNRSFPLITDGNHLFIITVQTKTVKRKLKPEMQEEYERLKKEEEDGKRKEAEKGKPAKKPPAKDAKKEEKKVGPIADTAKICEFYLVEFDVNACFNENEKYDLEKLNNPLVEELYTSFSNYFTKAECAYALKITGGGERNTGFNIQSAAQWLVDEGENERGKVTVTAKSSILLGQAVMRPEQDFEVVDKSVLYPYNVSNGLWTMSNTELTLHSNFPHAKIFSLNPDDIKPLNEKLKRMEGSGLGSPIKDMFMKEQALGKGQSHGKDAPEEDEEEEHPPGGKLPQMQRNNLGSGDEQEIPPPIPILEQQAEFFEEIELKGSFITTEPMEYFQYDHCCLSFDHQLHKFYMLFLGESTIAVCLEYSNFPLVSPIVPGFNLSSAELILNETTVPEALAHFLLQFLEASEAYRFSMPWKWNNWDMLYSKMKERLTLSYICPKDSSEQLKKRINAKLIKLRQRQEKVHDKQVSSWIQAYDIKEDDWINFEPISMPVPIKSVRKGSMKAEKKKAKKIKHPEPWENTLPPPSWKPVDSYNSPVRYGYGSRPSGHGRMPARYEYRGEFLPPPNASLPPPSYLGTQTFRGRPPPPGAIGQSYYRPEMIRYSSHEPLGRIPGPSVLETLAKDKSQKGGYTPEKKKTPVQICRESKKEVAFCTSGSLLSLKILMKRIICDQNKEKMKNIVLEYYNQLLLWILNADALSPFPNTGFPETLQELVLLLIQNIQNASSLPAEIVQITWRILINGWQILVRTTEVQAIVMKQIIKELNKISDGIKQMEEKGQLEIATCTSNGSGPGAVQGDIINKNQSYYSIMFSPASSVIELFMTKYFKYQSTYFPEYPIRRSSIQIFEAHPELPLPGAISQKPKLQFVETTSSPNLNIDHPLISPYFDKEFFPRLSMILLPSAKCYEENAASDQKEEKQPVDSNAANEGGISLDDRIAFYTHTKMLLDKSLPESEQEKHKQVLIEKLRSEHDSNVEQAWNSLLGLIMQCMNSGQQAKLAWSIFNKLISRAAIEMFNKSKEYMKFVWKLLKVVMQMIDKLKETTNNGKEIKEDMHPWIEKMLEFMFWVSLLLNISPDGINDTEYAVKTMPELLSLISKLKELAVGNIDPSQGIMASYHFSENTDFANEKIIETTHPYGRGEINFKEQVNFPCAIGVYCELDPRCQTESGNDYLMIYTSDTSQPVDNGIGTYHKFSGKHTGREKYILIGNKVTVEFRVSTQPKKKNEDASSRWGFKLVLHPIYGEPLSDIVARDCNERKLKKMVSISLPDCLVLRLLTSINSLVTLASRLTSSLLKGIDLTQDEILYKEFFSLPILREGRKSIKEVKMIKEDKKAKKTEEGKTEATIKEYKLNHALLSPSLGKAIELCKTNEGWIANLRTKIRQFQAPPAIYSGERQRPSFGKEYKLMWDATENTALLALLYHSGYEITDHGAIILDDGAYRTLGQHLNSIIGWMLSRLQGEREYELCRVSIIDDCIEYYTEYKEKKAEEINKKNKEAEEKKKADEKIAAQGSANPKEEVGKKKKKVSVSKSGSRKKKIVKQIKDEGSEAAGEEHKKSGGRGKNAKAITAEDIIIKELTDSEKNEFRQKLYQRVYDKFLQRYQGNFDLVKSLCSILSIFYTAKDPAEALKGIFKKIEESIKSIIDLSETSTNLPEKINRDQLKKESIYGVVANYVMKRAQFLFEIKALQKAPLPKLGLKAKSTSASPTTTHTSNFMEELPPPVKEDRNLLALPEPDLKRTNSLTPFIQGASTPEQLQKAYDSYLQWKKAKIVVDEEMLSSDSPLKSVITVLTSNWDPLKLRKAIKQQERRGLLRQLGLHYQCKLMQEFNNTMFKRLIMGNITDSILHGPFSNIEACGGNICGPISRDCLALCDALVETLCADCGVFKEIKQVVKKMKKKDSPDKKVVDENDICEHMKRLLQVFSDLTVLLHESANNNNIIINLCSSSSTLRLSNFLSSIVNIILMSQSYSAELQSNPPVSKLNSYLISSCQVILNRFLISAEEISAPEAKSSIQQLLLQIFVDTLDRECSIAEPSSEAALRFTIPSYQQKISQLLSFLYEIMLIFHRVNAIDAVLLNKTCSLLCYLMHISPTPLIVRLASKCAQLLYKFIDVTQISTDGIIKTVMIPTEGSEFSKLSRVPNNFVIQTLKKIGEAAIIRFTQGYNSKPTPKEFYVLLNLNSNEDDILFLLTAFYHWENLHPSFTECYPQTFAGDSSSQKEPEPIGMFTNTRFFINSQSSKAQPKPNSASIQQISQQFEEIVKLSYEEIKNDDSEAEKTRKFNEKNFNRRIRQHIADFKFISGYLLSKSYVHFPISLSLPMAQELCDLLYKAYNGQLSPIPINPYMKPESKTKKLVSTNLTIEASYPLTYRPPKPPAGKAPPVQPPPPITIAKAQLVLSLCDANIFEKLDSYLENISGGSQNRIRQNLDGTEIQCLQSPFCMGASISQAIQEYLQLLRSMLVSSTSKTWQDHIKAYVEKSLQLLGEKKWKEFSLVDKEVIFGCLILINGWSKCVRPGTLVEAVVNNAKAICTVVAGGFGTGKAQVTVIVKNDDSFVMHKIPVSQVKPVEEYKWPIEFSEELILKALLNCHSQAIEVPAQIPELSTSTCADILDTQMPLLLRLMLMKTTSILQWSQSKLEQQNDNRKKLMEIMAELSKASNTETTKETIEDNLTESWERLVERQDAVREQFFIMKKRTKAEAEKMEKIEFGKRGESKAMSNYVQPISSYLKSLPGNRSDANAPEESALKLLNHWEKHMIPKIMDFVKSSYQSWENNYYFEQLRSRLRKGDMGKAVEEALEMCDHRWPPNCVPPDENHDWSAFIPEECIVGIWAHAKIHFKRASESAHPLITRLIRQKVSELNVLIKLVDWHHQIALCEYADADTMQIYPIILPINSLKDLEKPLPVPAHTCSEKEILVNYLESIKASTISSALRTFTSMWQSLPNPFTYSTTLMPLPEIVHRITMDELSHDRVEGWLGHAQPVIELLGGKESATGTLLKGPKLLDNIVMQVNRKKSGENIESRLGKLERTIKDSVLAGNFSEVDILHEWCLKSWDLMMKEIASNRMSANLTDSSEIFSKAESSGKCELAKGKEGGIIFPLHMNTQTDTGAVIMCFEMGALLSPNSKLRFYSDQGGLNLVYQICVGKISIQSLPPFIINEGKVWCYFSQGTTANLSKEERDMTPPSFLPCCIYYVPAIWNTTCWLSEVLTNAFCLYSCKDPKTAGKLIDKYCKPLIKLICEFSTKSSAPSILKQFTYVLMNRILRKIRFMYSLNPYVKGNSLEKLGISMEWIIALMEELNKLRDNEDIGEGSLYSEYIQNGAELFASALLPFKTEAKGLDQLDIELYEKLKIPQWLRSVLNVGIYLNFFRGEGQLSQELISDIYNSFNLHKYMYENIYLLKGLPKKFNYNEVKEQILKVVNTFKGKIMNQDKDIIVGQGEDNSGKEGNVVKNHNGTALIILDGFDIPNEKNLSGDDAQNEDNNVEVAPPEEEAKVEEEREPPEWSCPACTLKNKIDAANCTACGTERPDEPVSEPIPTGPLGKVEISKCKSAKDGPTCENEAYVKAFITALREIGQEKKPKKEEKKKEQKKEEKKHSGKSPGKERDIAADLGIPPEELMNILEKRKEHSKEQKKEIKKEEAKKEEAKKEESKKEEEVKLPPPEPLVDVTIGTKFNASEPDQFVFTNFKSRLCSPENPSEFNKAVLKTIADIHQSFKSGKYQPALPQNEYLMELKLTKEGILGLSSDEFAQSLKNLMDINPLFVWEILAMQGYDLWLEKGGYEASICMPQHVLDTRQLQEMIKMVENEICRETRAVMRMHPLTLRFTPFTESPIVIKNCAVDEQNLRFKFPRILSHNLLTIRYNWGLLKNFNDNLMKAIPYINWAMCLNQIPDQSIPLTIATFLSAARSLCLNYVKISLQQAALEKTAVVRDRIPKLIFERLKLAEGHKQQEKGKLTQQQQSQQPGADNEKENDKRKKLAESMFYRAYEQIKEMDLSLLRPSKPQGSAPFIAFEIVFRGEHVVGEAGPYRQFFADISSELQPPIASTTSYTDTKTEALHLLYPTPNNKNHQGEMRDKFTFTPSAKTTSDLLLYEFLGILFGTCIRTGVHLSLDLPPIIWKQVVGEPISFDDFKDFDQTVARVLELLASGTITEEQFKTSYPENYCAILSDDTTEELIPGGNDITVEYQKIDEYISMFLKARLYESVLQCNAVRKGISLIVPLAFLNFLTHKEIESLICARPTVDLQMLKRHTRYGAGLNENSDRVKFFWEVMQELSEADKLKVIKFCWGQERLPASEEEYERRNVRFMIKPSMRSRGDEEKALPKADTCFFNLELPGYKSKENLKSKLLLAITTDCVSMNREDQQSLDPRGGGRFEEREEE